MVEFKKNEDIYLSGKARWFRASSLNKFGRWSHDLYLDTKSLAEFKRIKEREGGIKNDLKKDEDGYYITLNRDPSKQMKGKVVTFLPPEVTDREDKHVSLPIGNGSDVTSKMQLYWFKSPSGSSGSALRWVSTIVDNLVPYISDRDRTDEQKEAVSGLDEQPRQPLF